MPRSRHAELCSAFVWDCEHCGEENFIRAVEGELDEQDIEACLPFLVAENEMAEGVFELMHQKIAILPDRVSCKGCKRIYRSVVQMPEDDELY